MTRHTKIRPLSYDTQQFQTVTGQYPSYDQPMLAPFPLTNHRSGWNTTPLVPVPASWPPSSLISIQEVHRHQRLYSPTPDQSQIDSGHSLDTPIPLPPQTDPNVDVIPYLKPGSGLSIHLGLMLHRGHNQWPPIGINRAELPATYPPIPSMTITHPSLKPPIWITVHHSSRPTGQGCIRAFNEGYGRLCANSWTVTIDGESRSSISFVVNELRDWVVCCVARPIKESGLVENVRSIVVWFLNTLRARTTISAQRIAGIL
ncbi:hypothetical protein K435DRAFT_855562 [Dendrothele bispora CBS 962.96]|uniref:Uncharacterized protein n=1 Tax=Dendrothele bispora (strain CBS 962.96) TaxID=1314807 RepID=A0A4S8MC38_DENBC|nr:hypothetical protein K435DRAFT_855562 [Dendrothele bispora CBS 962.96]